MKSSLLNWLVISVLFWGCNSGHKHDHEHDHDHEHAQEHAHEEHTDEIAFTKEQAKAVELTVETVASSAFHQVIKTSGQIQAAQEDEVIVVATSNGVVLFANASIVEGTAVKAGQAIVSISSKNLLEGDPAVKAKIAYETAQKEYQRAEGLVKDQIISAKEYEQIRADYEIARTTYEAHAAEMSGSGVRVTSPIGGYIKSRLVSQGEYVSVGQPIAVVAKNRRLQLRAEVPERYYKSLKGVQSAHFKPSYDDTVYKLSELNGRLLSFGKVSGQSFYLPVTFEFDNVGEIIPGSFVEVFLLSASQEQVISVPVSSVTEEQGLYFVYLQLDEEGYKKQEITIGQNDGDRVRVFSGLKEGDRVVTKGVYQVKLAANSSVIPEGHSH